MGMYEKRLSAWSREKVLNSWMFDSFLEICGSEFFRRESSEEGAKTSKVEASSNFPFIPPQMPRETPHSPRSCAVRLSNGVDAVESGTSVFSTHIGDNMVKFIFETPLPGAAAAVGGRLPQDGLGLKSRLVKIHMDACLECHWVLLLHAWFNTAYIQMLALIALDYLERHGRFLIEAARQLFLLEAAHRWANSAAGPPRADKTPGRSSTWNFYAKAKKNRLLQRIIKWSSGRSTHGASTASNKPVARFPALSATRMASTDVVFMAQGTSSASKAKSSTIQCIPLIKPSKLTEPISNPANEFPKVVPLEVPTILTIQK
ncbi:unnamed protein product [Phytomonas sp. Hart1]|nr:unnamed protein product [Phytomonas sp. Hart1]|eukprot:CCW66059.1 unnamed protein product [Phytomonas sp. isolate Hart1]